MCIFNKNTTLSSLLAQEGLELEYVSRAAHDVEEVIDQADYVLSLLNTTPGMDAVLLGKPSAYYNLLNWGDLFACEENPIILKNQKEIEEFLLGQRSVGDDFLNRLDPYRDGRTKQRLCQSIQSHNP